MGCRLLYLVGQLRDGGLERQLYYLLQAMDRKQYRPRVVIWNFRDDDKYVSKLQELDVPLHPFQQSSSKRTKLKDLRNLVLMLKPEVLHSYSFYTNFAAWYATRGAKTVPLGSVRSDFVRDINESGITLGKLSARWPREQIFNSLAATEKARQYGSPFVPRNCFVVRNALDLKLFRFTPLPNGTYAKIVGIGSLAPVKRWDRVLNAAYRLKQESVKFAVRIVGDGPLRKPLEQQARDLGITDCVELIGRTENIPALLSEATVLVHTSENEGCPNVVMEAMACGRPVVATDVGDTRYLVDNGKTGFVVENGDDKAVARSLATLISNRELCAQMGAAGRVKAERDFDLGRLVEETLSAYRVAGWQDKQT